MKQNVYEIIKHNIYKIMKQEIYRKKKQKKYKLMFILLSIMAIILLCCIVYKYGGRQLNEIKNMSVALDNHLEQAKDMERRLDKVELLVYKQK